MTDGMQVQQISNNHQIVNLNKLDRAAEIYKVSSKTLKHNTSLIQKTIDSNTREEVKQVQEAINRLNKKVEQVMESEFIKDKKTKIIEAQKNMMDSIKEASKTFFQVKDVIMNKEHLTEEEKLQYTDKLFHKILDKFLSKEEKELFIKFIQAGPIFLLNKPHPNSMVRDI